MMNKRLFILLVAASMILAGCATPTPVPTAVPGHHCADERPDAHHRARYGRAHHRADGRRDRYGGSDGHSRRRRERDADGDP